MRVILFLIGLAVLGAPSCSRKPNIAEQDLSDIDVPAALAAAENQARKMADGFIKGETEAILDAMYPRALELIGGREKMLATIKKGMKEMKAEGTTFHSFRVTAPDKLYRAKNDVLSIVPEVVVMRTAKGKLQQDSFLLGISSDKGRSWKFIDGAGIQKNDVRSIIPHFPDGLELPKLPPPRLVKDDE
jgi:hypothetical protein